MKPSPIAAQAAAPGAIDMHAAAGRKAHAPAAPLAWSRSQPDGAHGTALHTAGHRHEAPIHAGGVRHRAVSSTALRQEPRLEPHRSHHAGVEPHATAVNALPEPNASPGINTRLMGGLRNVKEGVKEDMFGGLIPSFSPPRISSMIALFVGGVIRPEKS